MVLSEQLTMVPWCLHMVGQGLGDHGQLTMVPWHWLALANQEQCPRGHVPPPTPHPLPPSPLSIWLVVTQPVFAHEGFLLRLEYFAGEVDEKG